MHVRRATAADVDAIARVHVLAWQETYRSIPPDDFLASLSVERRREMWAGQLADPTAALVIFVATVEQETVGFAAAGAARDRGLGFDGELYAIYLLAAHQKKGFGRALFHAAAHSLRNLGCASMMLWVLQGNRARSFYDHLGGQMFREQLIEIGTRTYIEVAYGWPDLHASLRANDGIGQASPA